MLKKVKVFCEENAFLPARAHATDAGMDLRTPVDTIIAKKSSAIVDTGVHVEIPAGYVGFLKSKSGLNVKASILSEGVIDAGYTGPIVVKLYNHSEVDYVFKRGDKITQLVILPCETPEIIPVASLEEFADTERGDNGFGSSGK